MDGLPDRGVELAQLPTPIHRLDSYADEGDAELYVKRDDDTAGVAQGNKIRKLEYLFADAMERGADAVVTTGGTQSNHCRATSTLARRLGLEPHLVLHGEEPDVYDGNLLLDKIAGAEVTYISEETYRKSENDELEGVADRLRDEGKTPYIMPSGGSTSVGALGYVRAYSEIADYAAEEGGEFDRIFFAAGSGGTYAGLVAGAMYAGHDTEIVGVKITTTDSADIADAVVDNVAGLPEVSDLEALDEAAVRERITILDGYVGPAYSVPTDDDVATIVEVGRREGLILDTSYTGKAFRAFVEESEPGERNLFIHTGGSYGVFPKRERITAAIEGR